jgi:hypothetical protein
MGPFLTVLLGHSLLSGDVPSLRRYFKEAFIMPFYKKMDLDQADVKRYRLASNLSVVSKLLERPAAQQMPDNLNTAKLLPSSKSAHQAIQFVPQNFTGPNGVNYGKADTDR